MIIADTLCWISSVSCEAAFGLLVLVSFTTVEFGTNIYPKKNWFKVGSNTWHTFRNVWLPWTLIFQGPDIIVVVDKLICCVCHHANDLQTPCKSSYGAEYSRISVLLRSCQIRILMKLGLLIGLWNYFN